jgi:hypothetical protein
LPIRRTANAYTGTWVDFFLPAANPRELPASHPPTLERQSPPAPRARAGIVHRRHWTAPRLGALPIRRTTNAYGMWNDQVIYMGLGSRAVEPKSPAPVAPLRAVVRAGDCGRSLGRRVWQSPAVTVLPL